MDAADRSTVSRPASGPKCPSDQRALPREISGGAADWTQASASAATFGEACNENTAHACHTHAFADWLATTALSTTIQNVSWIIPTVQTVHIVCVAIVISAVFLVDMRILGVFARGAAGGGPVTPVPAPGSGTRLIVLLRDGLAADHR